MNLRNYFDRVVLINLPRRTDRLARVRQALRKCDWPFRPPEVFAAVDGTLSDPPRHWRHDAGAWGCLVSHRTILEQALRDGVKNILILEDDVCFADGFRENVAKFLRTVPDDWDGLMLGGQHRVAEAGWPALVRPGVCRCLDCERTHGYAVRGSYLAQLVARWHGGGKYRGNAHCDHIMGRDPQLQRAHRVYAPEYFLLGQERSRSDVTGSTHPRRFWNPPGPELPLLQLRAPRAVAEALVQYGIYLGDDRDPGSGVERKLAEIFRRRKKSPAKFRQQLHRWIISQQWEICGDADFIATVWHPAATRELLNRVSLWPVTEVNASTVLAARRQLKRVFLRPLKPINFC